MQQTEWTPQIGDEIVVRVMDDERYAVVTAYNAQTRVVRFRTSGQYAGWAHIRHCAPHGSETATRGGGTEDPRDWHTDMLPEPPPVLVRLGERHEQAQEAGWRHFLRSLRHRLGVGERSH